LWLFFAPIWLIGAYLLGGLNAIEDIHAYLYAQLSSGSTKEHLRRQCEPPMSVAARANHYLGEWANCTRLRETRADSKCTCDTGGMVAERFVRFQSALDLTFESRLQQKSGAVCFSRKFLWPTVAARLAHGLTEWAQWKSNHQILDMAKLVEAAPGFPHVGWLAKFADYPPANEYTLGAPVVAQVRSVKPRHSKVVLFKSNSHRLYGRLDMAMKLDVTPFAQKANAAVWRGTGTGLNRKFDGALVQRAALISQLHQLQQHPLLDLKLTLEGPRSRSDFLSVAETMRYKMIVVVEGHDTPSALVWSQASSSAVLMPPPNVAAWSMADLMVPWLHYVPLLPNVTDLPEKAAWCLANLAQCERIGRAGRCFVLQFADDSREELVITRLASRLQRIMNQTSCSAVCF